MQVMALSGGWLNYMMIRSKETPLNVWRAVEVMRCNMASLKKKLYRELSVQVSGQKCEGKIPHMGDTESLGLCG